MCYNKVYVIFLVGNLHHLLWFLSLITKHQQWHQNNCINKPSFLLVFKVVYKYCSNFNLLTDDRKIAGCWYFVLNSSMVKYFKNTQNFSTRALLFCLELTGTFYPWVLSNHLSYTLFILVLFSFLQLQSL